MSRHKIHLLAKILMDKALQVLKAFKINLEGVEPQGIYLKNLKRCSEAVVNEANKFKRKAPTLL
jgi:hypothetical protein